MTCSERPLLEEGMETFLRSTVQISVLSKVREKNEKPFSDAMNAGRYFGFHTRVIWNGETGTLQTADGSGTYPVRKHADGDYCVKVYIAHGECWIRPSDVTRNSQDVDKWKVLIPRAGNPGSTILGKLRLAEPGSCSSNTYNVVIASSEAEANSIFAYLKTRFARYLIATRTSTQDTAPKSFEFVPVQDWTKPWTDEELFEKYGLSQDEANTIVDAIPEMD